MDYFGLPSNPLSTQIFTGNTDGLTGADTKTWQIWRKPPNAKIVFIFIQGAGAGGGNGFTGVAATARGGGGGGASGGTVRAAFMAAMLPDTLYLQVPGTPAANAAGPRTYVSLRPSILTQHLLLMSSNADAGAGGNGTVSAAGAAGTAATVATTANTPLSAVLGMCYLALAGMAGAIGGAHTGLAGGIVSWQNAQNCSGGAGGGGTTSADFAGGNVQTLLLADLLSNQILGGLAGSNPGSSGIHIRKFLMSLGGAGGGSSNAGVGGAGGIGVFGSGGGGGGGGTTGGAGGMGGQGIAIIVTI